mmetsp:Transcript_13353/g.41288  ORF Transcript_13353/g.41288 Transcript_13353/m.41288 type:complete len:203 (+) Transcript_13353:129-737(+)
MKLPRRVSSAAPGSGENSVSIISPNSVSRRSLPGLRPPRLAHAAAQRGLTLHQQSPITARTARNPIKIATSFAAPFFAAGDAPRGGAVGAADPRVGRGAGASVGAKGVVGAKGAAVVGRGIEEGVVGRGGEEEEDGLKEGARDGALVGGAAAATTARHSTTPSNSKPRPPVQIQAPSGRGNASSTFPRVASSETAALQPDAS